MQTNRDGVITGRSVVLPGDCDGMGHCATRAYMGMFDDAAFHMLHEFGHVRGHHEGVDVGWADVQHTIHYRRELCEGDLIIVRSRPVSLGTSSVGYRHLMTRVVDDEVCATLDARAVQFDLTNRVAIPVIAPVRKVIERWLEALEQPTPD